MDRAILAASGGACYLPSLSSCFVALVYRVAFYHKCSRFQPALPPLAAIMRITKAAHGGGVSPPLPAPRRGWHDSTMLAHLRAQVVPQGANSSRAHLLSAAAVHHAFPRRYPQPLTSALALGQGLIGPHTAILKGHTMMTMLFHLAGDGPAISPDLPDSAAASLREQPVTASPAPRP